TAIGKSALQNDTITNDNTAIGKSALQNDVGGRNTAVGSQALGINTMGSSNTALGYTAGTSVTTANNVICIGAGVLGLNVSNSCFIGNISGVNEGGTISAVYINTDGQLGTQPPASSRRFKNEIKPMDQVSEAILSLKPVTFHYKSDTKGVPQFGLIAEEVAQVNPDLVVRDENGDIYTVRYDAVNAMLLNEFLKEHRKVEQQAREMQEQQATIAQQRKESQAKTDKLEATIAQQQKEMQAVIARLNEQAAQIQKVSIQLGVTKAAPRTVSNK
ncbi:MAG: hypothetical protein E6L08_08175, partial [Verrucomicrobia bacterium]